VEVNRENRQEEEEKMDEGVPPKYNALHNILK